MSKKNSPESKKERRIVNYLRKADTARSAVQFRYVEGRLTPFTLPPENYLQRYRDGLVTVEEIRHNAFIVKAIETREGVNIMDNNNDQDPVETGTQDVVDQDGIAAPVDGVEPTDEVAEEPSQPAQAEVEADQPAEEVSPVDDTPPNPDSARDLPDVNKKASDDSQLAVGEEMPGQAEAVNKVHIPVAEVSRIGEKVER